MCSLIEKEEKFFYGVEKKMFLYGVALDGLIGQGMRKKKTLKPPF